MAGPGRAGCGPAGPAPGSARVNTVRVFEDGDVVFAHTDANFFGPKIGFGVFRFEDGRNVEHWDNLQETPTSPNPSGHRMIDGPTAAADLALTADNTARVAAFVDDSLVNGRMERLVGCFQPDRYAQHHPGIGDGLAGLGAALEAMAKAGLSMPYDKVQGVRGEGNFVLTLSEGEFAGRHVAFYDLFRVEGGLIVEHWDVIQDIPAHEQWANANGKS
jgi:predicted SnoaL-like aldol condensation-catalyzing enzyme